MLTPPNPLPRAVVPDASVQMAQVPWTRLPDALLLSSSMPPRSLREMTFPAPGTVPPIVLPGTLLICTPTLVLPKSAVPAALTPI